MHADPYGAFCTHATTSLAGADHGPLAGLTFAAKDLISIAGHRSCAGHPRWLEMNPPATETAPLILQLGATGASLAGMTQLGSLAYDSTGENSYYGTPINPVDASRIPGGSSSGSAVAVAGNLVDFALGTDSACSVRIPASYCGLFGIRPTHGRISIAGVLPLSPSFDTVGWLARSGALLREVGRVLLDYREAPLPRRLIVATDALDLVPTATQVMFDSILPSLTCRFPVVEKGTLGSDEAPLRDCLRHFGQLQTHEVRRILGSWLSQNEPRYGSGAFNSIRESTGDLPSDAIRFRDALTRRLHSVLEPGVVLCFPTAAGAAPKLKDGSNGALQRRWLDLTLCTAAGLAGLPQVTLPIGLVDGLPVGVSLLGGPGADELLLELAR